MAKSGEFDYFTTTLTISPLKNAARLNEIGRKLEEEYALLIFRRILRKRTAIRDL